MCYFECIYYGNCDKETNEDETKIDDCDDCEFNVKCEYCTGYYCENYNSIENFF